MTSLKHFLRNEGAATAVEYGLIAGLLAIIVVGCLALIKDPVGGLFSSVVAEFETIDTQL